MKRIIPAPHEIEELLPIRGRNTHKGSAGKVLVVAGSRGMSGAAILSSRAVMRTGAGVATLATTNSLTDLIDVVSLEVMTLPLYENKYGSIGKKSFELILAKLEECDLLLIGPGLSSNRETATLTKEILLFISKYMQDIKVVVDADGLRGVKKLIRPVKNEMIITPHIGELARLMGLKVSEVKKRPEHYAEQGLFSSFIFYMSTGKS